MRIHMADLQAQVQSLHGELSAVLEEVLQSCRFILGPNVTTLEEELAARNGAAHAVAVASGTDAIMLALAACGVGPGDEVITTPFTFVATTETIVQIGGAPVYVDIDPRTFNLDATQVEASITPKTRAILPVHLYGQMADMTALEAIAKTHGLKLIADGAQAIGAKHRGKALGAFGDAATLSFFPTKNLGAFGDGGMVLTNDTDVAEKVKLLRFHGSGGTYDYQCAGWCSRLDEVQAAILRVKLKRLAEWNGARRRHAAIYNEMLEGCGLALPCELPGDEHVWHQYTLRGERRDDLKQHLAADGIDSAVYYPGPLHIQPAYAKFGYKPGDMPEAEKTCREVLSLPVYPELPDDSVRRVAESVLRFQKAHA